MNAHDKARLLGLFFWLFTALNILAVGIFSIIFFVYFGVIAAVLAQGPHKANDPPPEVLMGIVVVVFVVVFAMAILMTVVFSVPKVIAGIGLRKNKPWARTWAITASVICCLSFPIGTAIGIFGLIFLFSDDGKRYFEDAAYRSQLASGSYAPPPPNSWQ